MERGIYIVANDRVLENAIALLNSIRLYDPEIPIILVPFNDDYQKTASTLGRLHNVQVFPDLALLERLTVEIGEIFDRGFLALPNKMRKLATWFGPLERFLYIDVDIIVFDRIASVLDYLDDHDFLCCDYHYKGRGLQDIFSPLVREQGIFSDAELLDVFNSGFWASRKAAITEDQMKALLRECAAHREYFDFSRQTTDQPILNYMVLKAMPRRINLARHLANEPGSWGGSPHFQEREHILYDGEKPLRYLHWAGTPMKPGGPYRELWEHYRYLYEPKPPAEEPSVAAPSFWQMLKQRFVGKS